MSYNSKNYTEQGGDVTRIGGRIIIESGGSIEGLPAVSNQAASTAATVAAVKDDFNSLLNKLKDSGYMTNDAWPSVSIIKQPSAAGEISKATYEANMSEVSSVSISGDVISITVDVDDLTSYEGAAGYGNHKWIGFLITTGFSSIVGMKLNGTELTSTDAQEATDHSGNAGDLSLYFAADTIDGKTFTLWHTGSGEKKYTVKLVAPAEQ